MIYSIKEKKIQKKKSKYTAKTYSPFSIDLIKLATRIICAKYVECFYEIQIVSHTELLHLQKVN